MRVPRGPNLRPGGSARTKRHSLTRTIVTITRQIDLTLHYTINLLRSQKPAPLPHLQHQAPASGTLTTVSLRHHQRGRPPTKIFPHPNPTTSLMNCLAKKMLIIDSCCPVLDSCLIQACHLHLTRWTKTIVILAIGISHSVIPLRLSTRQIIKLPKCLIPKRWILVAWKVH